MRFGVPFDDGRLSYGGYDSNLHPANGTARAASSTSEGLRLSASSKGRGT